MSDDEDRYAAIGKSLLLEVSRGDKLTYLRLGEGCAADATNARGGDLVQKVRDAGPEQGLWKTKDFNTPAGDGHAAATGKRVFEDDWRVGKVTHTASPGALVSTTKTPSGWRDHTDGDRITTTRGDKLEVIGGNYKLVVLGRPAGTSGTSAARTGGDASGMDFSGGQYHDFHAYAGVVTEIQSTLVNGLARVYEKTTKGGAHRVFSGKLTEEYYGGEHKTYVGFPPDAPAGDNLKVSGEGTDPAVYETVTVATYGSDWEVDGTHTSVVETALRRDITEFTGQFREVLLSSTHLYNFDCALFMELVSGIRQSTNAGGVNLEMQFGIRRADVQVGPLVHLWTAGTVEATTSELWLAKKRAQLSLSATELRASMKERSLKSTKQSLEQKVTVLTSKQTALTTDAQALDVTYNALSTKLNGMVVL